MALGFFRRWRDEATLLSGRAIHIRCGSRYVWALPRKDTPSSAWRTNALRSPWLERLLLAAVIVGFAALAAEPSFAQSASFQPLNTAMSSVLSFMTGTFATTCATIAVCAVGFMAFTSRIPWGWAFSVMVGVALIFGSAQIVSSLTSGLSSGQ
jgi:type IV secretion system protein VirB2